MKKYISLFLLFALCIYTTQITSTYPMKPVIMEEYDSVNAVLTYVDPNKKMIALTFDDGPTRKYTTQILDCLQQYNAHATFFLLGSRIEGQEDVVLRIYSEGHEIGNHSFSHKQLNAVDEATVIQEIQQTNDAIYQVVHAYPKIIRAPYGEVNDIVKANLGNMTLVKWNIDSEDWRTDNASVVVNNVLRDAKDKGIILMHDMYQSSADATCALIPALQDQGYQLVTMSQLLSFESEP